MDFDRADFANPYSSLSSLGVPGNSAGMNDISALAAAASDQLYELERHEAFRRAEYELRHRQIAGARKSNGNSPAGTPGNGSSTNNNNANSNGNNNFGGTYGFSNERERWGLTGVPAPSGGQIVYPISAPQPPTANHPAVPAGTLADPTYLVPPSCCHEDCHKSYRKRLKVAKQTAACPNCLSVPNGSGGGHAHGGLGGAGGGGSDSHHSSSSNTPKDRSAKNSSEDLTKLGGGQGNGGPGGNSYALHHNLHQQLARLQQQHHLALQKAHAQQMATAPPSVNPYKMSGSHSHAQNSHIKPYTLDLHAHRGLLGSAAPSRAVSPESDDSSDDEPTQHNGLEFQATSPVLTGMRSMSLFQNRATTAPVSAVTSPVHSRAPSRAASPVEGHSANSGKHGHGSHQARDAKNRSHPYTHYSNTTPNSPHFASQKHRMSPPKMSKTLSGHANAHSHHSHGHGHAHRERESLSHGHSHSSHAHGSAAHHKSVEDILNSSGIPPPPPHSDRTLPPPNTSSSFSAGVPSMSYSLSSQPASTHASPNTSRASSPTHTVPHSHSHSHLAHSVRAAFGMTPMSGNKTPSGSAQSPPNRLPPMGGIGVGMGNSQGNMGMSGMGGMMGDQKVVLPSFSRGSSPVHLMEVDGHA